MHRLIRSIRSISLIAALTGSLLAIAPAPALVFVGGPTHFATMSDGISIAMSVVVPPTCSASNRCPAILEMAGYENGSASPSGRTMIGEAEDHYESYFGDAETQAQQGLAEAGNELESGCRALADAFGEYGDPYEENCSQFGDRSQQTRPSPPLTNDSHEGTSAFRYDGEYVLVHASVRGTGCSSGEFDLFSQRSALDGKEIIDNWMPTQPWFDATLGAGILGHSYSGMTGFLIASTQPANLKAVTVSGLIDDLYRGITFPGGVSNGGFPVLWTLGIRVAYDVLGGSAQGLVRHAEDENGRQCAANVATHSRNVAEDPVLNGIVDTDGPWFRERSLIEYADQITVPIHMSGAYQDEQTGPRFANLWENVNNAPAKRLLMMNGDHGSQVSPTIVWQDRKAWMDYWMLGIANPFVPNPDNRATSVRSLYEMRSSDSSPQGIKDSNSFPLEDTTWTPYYFSGSDSLVTDRHAVASGSGQYFSGTGRQSWSYQAGTSPVNTEPGQDELTFTSPGFVTDTAIAGPITANLFIQSTAKETELMVQLIDIAPDGARTYLQRGLLRGGHRAFSLDPNFSDYSSAPDPLDPSGRYLYRPFRAHAASEPVTPGTVTEYLVEVFPVGHVFRAGHKLQVKVQAPSRVDSYYAYIPKAAPGVNTLYFSTGMPSRITLPFVGLPGGISTSAPLACGQQEAVRCIR